MSWQDDFRRAYMQNCRALLDQHYPHALNQFAHAHATGTLPAWARKTGEILPYRFERSSAHIASFAAALKRGYWACGDATAWICALAWCHRVPHVICYEAQDDGYAHVRPIVDGVTVEPFPLARRPMAACTSILHLT